MKLSEFLKENNAYEKFIENCLEDGGTVASIRKNTLVSLCIGDAFYWEETTEGGDFWEELSYEFENLKEKIYDMDAILYEECNKRITIEEETGEPKESEDKIITLEGKRYKLVPIEEEKSLDGMSIIKEKYKSGNYIAIRLKDNKWELCDQEYKENFRGSNSIKLIKKEHRDILEAYLKDTDIKTEYRWYDEPWMELEGDFIENYDENMQLRKVNKEFKPFTFNIEIKTLDDLKSILNRFNLDEDYFKEISKEKQLEYYDVCSDIDERIWGSLRDKLDEFE